MTSFTKPPYEEQRVNALRAYDISYTNPEQDFDDVTLMATQICNTPIAFISLIDEEKQWFKSSHGANMTFTPRKVSICTYAIQTPEKITEIEDARENSMFYDNPFVTGPSKMVFYASSPLVTPEGLAIGTICVLDKKPRKLSIKQKKALKALSRQVINALEIRKNKKQLQQNIKVLVYKNVALEGFTDNSVEDMKSPINTITLLAQMLKKSYSSILDSKGNDYLNLIKDSSNKMIDMINHVKEFHQNLDLITHKKETFFVKKLIKDITTINFPNSNVIIEQPDSQIKIYTSKGALKKILTLKISNFIEQNSVKDYRISINFEVIKNALSFTIKDNGPILKAKENTFAFNNQNLKQGNIVKILLNTLGGNCTLNHIEGTGNIMKFNIPQ